MLTTTPFNANDIPIHLNDFFRWWLLFSLKAVIKRCLAPPLLLRKTVSAPIISFPNGVQKNFDNWDFQPKVFPQNFFFPRSVSIQTVLGREWSFVFYTLGSEKSCFSITIKGLTDTNWRQGGSQVEFERRGGRHRNRKFRRNSVKYSILRVDERESWNILPIFCIVASFEISVRSRKSEIGSVVKIFFRYFLNLHRFVWDLYSNTQWRIELMGLQPPPKFKENMKFNNESLATCSETC